MRSIFSIVSLLVALALVALIARKALLPAAPPAGTPATTTVPGNGALSQPQQARQAEAQVRQALNEAAAAAQRQRDAAEKN